jgi:uncharacterized membrane protein YozB (DUF420 family)
MEQEVKCRVTTFLIAGLLAFECIVMILAGWLALCEGNVLAHYFFYTAAGLGSCFFFWFLFSSSRELFAQIGGIESEE